MLRQYVLAAYYLHTQSAYICHPAKFFTCLLELSVIRHAWWHTRKPLLRVWFIFLLASCHRLSSITTSLEASFLFCAAVTLTNPSSNLQVTLSRERTSACTNSHHYKLHRTVRCDSGYYCEYVLMKHMRHWSDMYGTEQNFIQSNIKYACLPPRPQKRQKSCLHWAHTK